MDKNESTPQPWMIDAMNDMHKLACAEGCTDTECISAIKRGAEIIALRSVAGEEPEQPDVSIPMVIDGACGVRGHDWCIRRFRTEGTVHTAEYWSLGKWGAFCYVFKEKELAECVCASLRRPAPPQGKEQK